MGNSRSRQKTDVVVNALRPYGTSIFTEMTVLANAHGDVNLSQGFPSPSTGRDLLSGGRYHPLEFDDDLALYAKTHQIGLLHEDQHYDPGDRTASFHLNDMEAACLICYDLRFPELFHSLADRCAVILVIASWPGARQRHWDILLPARAVENHSKSLAWPPAE
ncbi:MAG: hypothetical protein ISR62_03375 [Desulfobacteraceae bacterium]|nr:hypothetical protein [Desulfobacterales bacterium]MBL6967445.1 hypothetical protein [Desulfobacteraceae bacterium]MBL7172725.1 hypothetical protein [Desulfobacteraceae bacterium]